MSLFDELKRRNVFRVGAVYLVTAWLVAQVADLALDNFESPGWVIKTILLVLVIGFPVALVFAWAFEKTPEGIMRQSEVDRSQSITPVTGQKLDRTIITVLGLAVIFLMYKVMVQPDATSDSEPSAAAVTEPLADKPADPAAATASDSLDKSIAVLPFENRSSLAEDVHFVDGIQDDILTQLSKLSGLDKVISRTSVERYRDTRDSVPEIGKALGVATILEGGVQRSGNTVRITVQLIEAASDKHLWSETFDRELTAENLFAVQSQISTEIARLLQVVLTANDQSQINRIPTSNLEAYNQFVAGREALRLRTGKTIRVGLDHFRKAVQLDPKYAQAHAGIAEALLLSTEYGNLSLDTVDQEIREEIDRALQLDPALGEAYAVSGSLADKLGEDEEAEAKYRKAMELSPNYSRSYHWLALMFRDSGRFEEGLELITRAHELDPDDPTIVVVKGTILARLGDVDAARSLFLQGIERRPDFPELYSVLGGLFHQLGDFGRSGRLLARAHRLNPERSLYVYLLCRSAIFLNDADLRSDCPTGTDQTSPNRRVYRLFFRGSLQEAVDLAEIINRESEQDDFWETYVFLLLLNADWQAARILLEQNAPAMFQSGTDNPKDNADLRKLLYVATAMRDGNGWTETARDKAQQVLENISLADEVFRSHISMWAHGLRGEIPAEIDRIKREAESQYEDDLFVCAIWDSPLFQQHFDLGPDAEAFIARCRAPAEQRQWYRENRDKPINLDDYR